jgi:eukaryotic translation initiation factor 2-alpha kinase 4
MNPFNCSLFCAITSFKHVSLSMFVGVHLLQIPLSAATPASYSRIMREVTTLSRLHHPNVVRYYNSWVEEEEIVSKGKKGGRDATKGGAGDFSMGSSTGYSYEGDETSLLSDSTGSEATPNLNPALPSPPLAPLVEEEAEDGSRSEDGPATVVTGVAGESDGSGSSPGFDQPSEEQGLESSDGFTFDRTRPPAPHDDTWERTEQGDADTGGRQAGAAASHIPLRKRQMLYIQMEFCPRTLRDVLDAGDLTEPGRWSTLRQLLAGLQHIHAQGIIHRDLKPANLFYDAKGEIKLGDFGE